MNQTNGVLTKTFKSHGFEYEIDINGAVKQIDPEPFTYDLKYCSTYDSEAYKRGEETLQALRLGFITGVHDRAIKSITDIGYGNGAFMRFCRQVINHIYGYDVTGIEVEGCKTYKIRDHHLMAASMQEVDVITFFDCLEHIPDITFLNNLPAETLVISLPYCHLRQLGPGWFNEKYKHRKPNEHIWHFDFTALVNTLRKFGWQLKASSCVEDIIRVSPGPWQNILTCGFKRL